MKTFEYKGYDSSGHSCRGLAEALDIKEARERLAARGIFAERVKSAGEQAPSALRPWRDELNVESRTMLYREVGALLRAGLPLANALEVLIAAPELGTQRTHLAGIRDRIREGTSLAEAVAQSTGSFSPFERAVIEVGERSGTLETALERLAKFLEEQQRVKERIQTALIYPAIVVTLAIVISVVMLGVMIPRWSAKLAELNIQLPLLTQWVLAIGKWILPVSIILVLLLGVGSYFLVRQMRADEDFRVRGNRLLFRLPLVRRGYSALVNLRFARTLSLLLSGGVSLVEGVGLAGRATGSAWVSRLAENGAEALRHGKSLAEAVRAIEPLSASLPGWIQSGEASGNLEDLLENAGDRYQQQWDRLISRGLSVLEPVLILAVGLFVLLIALSILMPVMSLNQAMM
jgi:general secretion pathway protein F